MNLITRAGGAPLDSDPELSPNAPPCPEWQTLDCDIAARMYRNDMQLLFNFGIAQASAAILQSIRDFEDRDKKKKDAGEARSTDMAAAMILQPVSVELHNVLTLAIQGHFEKPFRRWLQGSARDNPAAGITEEDIVKAVWNDPVRPGRDLGMIMAKLRGIHLKDTPEGPWLLELALIGNVVRHGDGPSARQALKLYPHLFLPVPELEGRPQRPEDWDIPGRLQVSDHRLAMYGAAAWGFWNRVQYAFTGEE